MKNALLATINICEVTDLYVIFTGKAKIERESRDLKAKYGVLDSARSTVGILMHVYVKERRKVLLILV